MKIRIAEHNPHAPNTRGVESVDAAGQVRGRIAFDTWRPNSAAVHIELGSPIALRKLLAWALHFAFEEAKLGVVIGFVRGTSRVHGLAKRIGFRLVGVVKDGHEVGSDLYIYELRREACAFSLQRKVA